MLGEVLQARGTVEFLKQDLPATERAFRRALPLARQHQRPFLEARTLGSLGLATMQQDRYDEAIDWFKASLALSEPLGARASSARTRGNLGWSYFKLGDYTRALSFLSEAELAEATLGMNRDRVITLTNIGTVHLNESDLTAADAEYKRALPLARQIGDRTLTMQCLLNLARVALRRGDYGQAESLNEEARNLERESGDRSEEPSILIISGRIAEGRKHFVRAEELFLQVQRENENRPSTQLYAHEDLARLYFEQGRTAESEREFRAAFGIVERARGALRGEELRLSFLTNERDLYDDFIRFLIAHQRFEEALAVTELSRARTLAEGVGAGHWTFPLKGFDPRGTAQRRNATILSYWLSSLHSYLWVISPAGKMDFLTLPAAKELEPLVQAYREALVGSRDPAETANPAGSKLYEILVAPAQKFLPKNSRVVIIPDGSLYRLSFDALLTPGPQSHYWIEDATLSTASSVLLLQSTKPHPRTGSGKMLLIGNAVSSSDEFPALRQAASEIARIQKYFQTAQLSVAEGDKATSAAYLEAEPGKYEFVHFVAHGTASRLSPLDSAVILSGPKESFKLYARDIIRRPLHARLVTISACNGAGTRTYAGEGLVGLSWAFLRAGAHNVIAALWEVDDASTPKMMDTLYGELQKGTDAPAALRAAKLAMLRSGTVYRKPYYWAPFQLYAGS